MLARKYRTMDNLANATCEELSEIKDIGEVMANSIREFFSQEQTSDLLNKLKSVGVNMNCLEEESTENNENAPVIRLNGNYVEYVEINTEYVEKGGTAYSNTGIPLKLNLQIKSNDNGGEEIETSELGTYKLIYSATDKNGLTTTSIRTVVVRDTIPPVIQFPEDNIVKVSELNGSYVEEGVYAIDNSNDKINVTCVSSLSNVPGKHVILYTAKDPSGNTTNAKRVITVVND